MLFCTSILRTPSAGTGYTLFTPFNLSIPNGCSITGKTVITTFAVLLSSSPSLALYINKSEPLKPASGVYFTVEPDNSTEPLVATFTMLYVNASSSASVAIKTISTAVSWFVFADKLEATGGLLFSANGFTVIVAVATLLNDSPS